MALYPLGKLNTNDQERQQGSVSFEWQSLAPDGTVLVAGDILTLGPLPKASLATKIVALSAADGGLTGATYDLGNWDKNAETFTILANIVHTKGTAVIIPTENTNVVNPDGSAYTGTEGAEWTGEGGKKLIAVRWTGADSDIGQLGLNRVIVEYTKFNVVSGNYGSEAPLSVY